MPTVTNVVASNIQNQVARQICHYDDRSEEEATQVSEMSCI